MRRGWGSGFGAPAACEAAASAVVEHAEARASALTRRLDDDNWFIRHAAVQALAWVVATPDVRGTLIERLTDADVKVRGAAALALETAAAAHADVRTVLIERLGDPSPFVRRTVLVVSAPAAGVHLDVFWALMKCLDDGDWDVCSAACLALAGVVGDHADVRAALMGHLGRGRSGLLLKAAALKASARALHHTDVRTKVIGGLNNPHCWVRAAALGALSAPALSSSASERRFRTRGFWRLWGRRLRVQVAVTSWPSSSVGWV